jgi:formyl-CoA transferase
MWRRAPASPRPDIAFASLNDMEALSRHPHLRWITVDTPAGKAAIPAPGVRIVGEERSYGAVPALGQSAMAGD